MANIKSAQKQAKQAEARRQINLARRTSIKTAIKRVLTALEKTENPQEIQALLKDAEAKIARAKNKNLFHANTSARKISRLAKKVAQAQKQK